jgi:hypothetical protein
MPKTPVVIYQEADGTAPFVEWFATLSERGQDKCRVRIERLAELGHDLRRPESDLLRDGIHELRAAHGGLNYRILYFFHGRGAVVLSHGIVKQRAAVPEREVDRAIARKLAFAKAPKVHTYQA